MTKLLFLIFFAVTICKAQVNVYVALPTSVAAESGCDDSFILGYESTGGTFTGNLKLDSFVTGAEMNSYVLPYCQSNGYDLVIRPSAVSGYSSITTDSFYNQGIQIITSGGSNTYHNLCNSLPLKNIIQCGGGDTANMTCYYIEFYGLDPFGFNSQSYGHAYVAGQISYVKDQRSELNGSCSWWEARYSCRMTGSEDGVYDQYNGYGKINIDSAIAYSGSIPADPYNTLGSIGSISASRTNSQVYIQFPLVTNALKYEIYSNSQLLTTISAGSGLDYYSYTISRFLAGRPKRYWYRAVRGSQTVESESFPLSFYYYSKIRLR